MIMITVANTKKMHNIPSPITGMMVSLDDFSSYVYSGTEWLKTDFFDRDIIMKKDLRNKKIRRLIYGE